MLQVRSAQQTAACRAPTAAEAAALTNFVTVMDFQMSLPPLEEADAAVPSGCGPCAMEAAPAAHYPVAHQQQQQLAAVPEPDSPAIIRADIFDAAVPQQAPPQPQGADWQALKPYPPASECALPQVRLQHFERSTLNDTQFPESPDLLLTLLRHSIIPHVR